jgi:hypothetical protein
VFDVKQEVLAAVRKVEEANTLIATLKSAVPADTEHYLFQIGVRPDQARELAIFREDLVRDLAQLDEEIRNWTSGMGWLPPDQQPLALPTLRERQRILKAKIDWIDRQLTLSPPPQ